MLRTALAGLRYRRTRLALSSLAIVLSVAFLAGTLTLNATMKQAFYTGFATGSRNVSAVVAADKSGNPPGQFGGQTVPTPVLSEVRAVPGVVAAAGRLTGAAPLIGSNGRTIGNGFAIGIPGDPALRGFTLVSGHLPATPGQVAVDQTTAANGHFQIGQPVQVADHTGTRRTFYLNGTIDLGVNPQFGNATVAAFQTPVAARITGQTGYGLIAARAAPGVSQSALVASIRSRQGLSQYRVETGSQFATEELDSAVHVAQQFTTGLLIFALVALVVACIVVYNTLSILIAQRGREMALLRCVGATRRQIFGGAFAESLIIGLVASAGGVAAGIGLSWGLQEVLRASGSAMPPGPLVVQPSAIAIALVTGTAITAAASALPARSATRIPPVAALGSAEPAVTAKAGRPRLMVAMVSGSAGAVLTFAGTRHVHGSSGFIEIAAGGCACFVAVLALGPLIAPPVISFLGWLPARLAGATARLATANARRNPHRIAATTAAFSIGITLMTLFTVVASSVQASSGAAIQGHFPFSYIVQPSQNGQTVPPRIVHQLQASPKVGEAAPYYAGRAPVNGTNVFIGAVGDSALGKMIKPAMVSGSLTAIRPGTAAVDLSVLSRLRTRNGGTLTISTPGGIRQTLRVVAVYDAATYRTPLPAVVISAAGYLHDFRPSGADQVIIDAPPGVPAATSRAAVSAAIASDPLLTVQTQAGYKASLNSQVGQILAIVGALLALAVLIALSGISNTLTLSVIERTRESALLRALGLTRGQLRRMLLTEALLMAAFAAALGIGLGVTFGVVMVHQLSASENGGAVLSIPYAQLALYAAISTCAALAAAILPAQRATRTSVISAMAET